MFFIIYFWIKNINISQIRHLLTWIYFRLWWVVVNIFWLKVGGGGWWWIYIGGWWEVMGCGIWQSVKVSNVFDTLTFKQIFWKTKAFFEKLEYRFLVKTTQTENTFPFKTALSEANIKANRMVTTKWTYHRVVFRQVTTYLFFWRICSSFRTS